MIGKFHDVELAELLETVQGRVDIYTDGACSGNPGPGGWAAIFVSGMKRARISGSDAQTTNNRMELIAAIEGIKAVPKSIPLTVYTDSSYLKNGATLWLGNWIKRGWKSNSGTAVKNQDLWHALSLLLGARDIDWVHVKGHSSCVHNNLADSIAKSAIVSLYVNDT